MRSKHGDDWAGESVEADPRSVFGDFGATPAIASAYGANFAMLEFHYYAQSEAERRRRMAIGLLFQLQDRRAVPDAHAYHVSCQATKIDPDTLVMIDQLEDLLHCDDTLSDTKREAIRRAFRVEKFDVAHVVGRKRLELPYLAGAQSKHDSALRVFVTLGDPISRNGALGTA